MAISVAGTGHQLEQRERALRKANAHRSSRSKLKGQLKSGEVTLEELLGRHPHEDPEWLTTMRIAALIIHTPGIGKTKCRKAYRRAQLSEGLTFRATPRATRQRLLTALHSTAPAAFR